MSKDNHDIRFQQRKLKEALSKGGLENLSALINNWVERDIFSPDEIDAEIQHLISLLMCVEIYKNTHPGTDTKQALHAILDKLTAYYVKLKQDIAKQ